MTAKERNINTARKICDLYATDKYTIENACESQGVPYATFYGWITPTRSGHIQEVQEIYLKANEERRLNRSRTLRERKESIGEIALESLKKKVQGWQWQEITKEGKGKDAESKNNKTVRVVDKFQVPDTTSLIFALTNAFPEEFKNKHNTDITSGDKPIISKVEVEIVRSSDIEEYKDGDT